MILVLETLVRNRQYRAACYNAIMLPDLQLDDIVRLRKPHPCGEYRWKVVRLGADIGLECLGCGRRVLIPRRQLARRIKRVLPKDHDEETSS